MNFERLPEYLTTTVVTGLGIGLALYCGRLSGNGQIGMLALICAGLLGLFVCLKMRSQIWIIIPIAWALIGRVTVLPLPFSIRDLGVMTAFAVTLALIALKFIRRKPTYDKLDLLLGVTVLMLLFAFLRNPVGTLATGSDRVGGKPYFDVFIGVLAYFVLSRAQVLPAWASRMPIFFTAGPALNSLLNVVAFQLPWTAPYLAQVYSTVTLDAYERQSSGGAYYAFENRQAHLAGIGEALGLMLCSFFRPITLLSPVHLLRVGLFLLAAVCALKSGHRIAVLDIGVFFLLASYFRRGIREVIHISLIAAPILGMVLVLHGTFFTLPLTAQRALSFLPGRWDPLAVSDAEGTIEWRVQMWKTALSTDRYIQNKILGDGFGYSLREYYNSLLAGNWGSGAQTQESFMVQGAFHSGPLSVIRTIGYSGLLVFMLALGVAAVQGARTIRRAEGTPYYPLALFVCIPLVYEPVKFIVVFGSLEGSLPHALFTAGLLKLLNVSLSEYKSEASRPQPARIHSGTRTFETVATRQNNLRLTSKQS